MRNELFVLSLLTCLLAMGTFAQARQRCIFPEKELIGRADVVAVAMVRTIEAVPLPISFGREPVIRLGLHIDNMLKGADGIKEVTARCELISVQARAALSVGQQQLFFLQQSPNGYFVLNALDSILAASEAGRIQELIALNPLVVTLPAKMPMLTLEQLREIPVTVANRGTERIEVYGYVEGFFEKPEAGTWLAFDEEVGQQCLRRRMTLEPGEEKNLSLIFRAKQYPLAGNAKVDPSALFRAGVRMSDYNNGFHMATAWTRVTVRPQPAQ